MRKPILILFLSIFLISLVSAGNLSLWPNPNEPNVYIAYVFNFSNSSTCDSSNIILSHSETVLTNPRGFGYVSINISNLSSVSVSLCEYKDGTLRVNHSFSDIIFNSIYAQNLNISENIKADGNITASIGFFSYLGSLANRITNLFTTNINASGNISIDGYYSGQPIDGSIGSGIINSSSNLPCGCINVTDDGVLDVTYPDLKVRIWDLDGTTIYCDIPSASPTVPDDAHTVYYIDSACSVQTMTWSNYFAQDRSPANWARIFDIYAPNGDIEVLKGASVIGLTDRRVKFANVNCGGGGHLGVCDGMRASRSDTFPELNLSSGHFEYVNTIVPSEQRDSNPDGIHITCYSDGSHTAETEIDIDKCDNGASCDACPTNQYRRYIIFNIGWGTHTRLHQLAPLDGDTYTTLSNCINTEKYELSYTFPTIAEGVAIPVAFYCGKRDDTAWVDGWVDLRAGVNGFGASPDLSGFMTYDEWAKNANANDYNLTDGNYLQFTTLNITGTAYIGELTWNGNLNLGGNNITNINLINATDWTNVTITESQISDFGSYILTTSEENLNVNSSDFWDIYNVPTDLNYRLLLYWANITGRPTHLSNFTDNILWTAGFNTTFDSRDSDTNVTTECGSNQYLDGDGTCVSADSTGDCGAGSVCEGGHTHPASQVTTGTFGAGNYVMDTNLTIEKIVFESDAGHTITDNVTCIIIKGDTSTLNIC